MYRLGVAALLFLALLSSQAFAERRVALVIGNSAYRHVPVLANPRNDAADMTVKLEGLGFEVVSGNDLDLGGLRRTVRNFVGRLEGADMALFFYAGHGLQVNGENYIAPVDAQLTSYLDLDFETLPINLILSAMERSTKVNLVFLDACRDNPLAGNLSRSMGTRSAAVGRGLAKLGSGIGSLIAFATQPGNVALDGEGRNSPFTAALLRHLGTPDQDITRDLVRVRRDVLDSTDGKQVPWETSSLTGDVILKAMPREEPKPDNAVELAYWDTIKDLQDRGFFEIYLKQYPHGAFSPLARMKMLVIDRRAAEVAAQRKLDGEVLAKAEADRQARDKALAVKAAERARQQAIADTMTKRQAEDAKAKAEAERRIQQQALAEQEAETARQQAAADTAAKRQALEASAKAEAARQEEERVLAAQAAEIASQKNLSEQQALTGTTSAITDTQPQELAALARSNADDLLKDRNTEADRDIVRSVQKELNRLGCSAGSADGIWGAGSRRAMEQFVRRSALTFASLEPSSTLLGRLQDMKSRVCPLVCSRTQKEKNGRCVDVKFEVKLAPAERKQNSDALKQKQLQLEKRQPEKKEQKIAGTCPASVKADARQTIVRAFRDRTNFVVATHPCGRKYTCTSNTGMPILGDWSCFWQ